MSSPHTRAGILDGVRTAVVVAPSPVPLRLGGAERHWETLRRSLEDAGVAADLVKVPVREHSLLDLLDGYEAFATLDLSHADLVITGKYPAWMVSHPNHVVWMLHPLRGLYDTYNPAAHEATPPLPDPFAAVLELLEAKRLESSPRTPDPFELIDRVRAAAADLGSEAPFAAGAAAGPEGVVGGGPLAIPGPLAREVVHALDTWALDPHRVRRHLAISGVVARRPGYFPPGVDPAILIPPSCLPEPSRAPDSVDRADGTTHFLAVGRLDGPKRFELAVDAVRSQPGRDWTLTVVGDGPEREGLAERAGGDPRITFSGRVDDTELAAAYRKADAVVVTPDAEDFGYVTIEAFQAGTPVITTTDSGGPAELATSGHDALVVEPGPAAIAAAMAEVETDPDAAAHMGENARNTAAAHSWPAAVEVLLSEPPKRHPAPGRKGRIAAVSTYPIAEWPGGGPQRARHLLGALADRGWEVDVVTISPGSSHEVALGDGFSEHSVALSERHLEAEKRLRRLTASVAVTDIAASVLWPSSNELSLAMRSALDGASVVVAVQPYLAPAVSELAPGVPLVLDAHNHERSLKAQMMPADEAGRWMLDRVADAEALAAGTAALVVATTDHDARSLEDDHDLEAGSVVVVPNGVDTSRFAVPDPHGRAEAKRRVLAELAPGGDQTDVALFVGSAHRPNIDAAREILSMADGVPHVLFVLAGEHSDQIDEHDTPANVSCVGAVADERLTELLDAADVALNPMRSGGGSNLKVLRYFAGGVPVVSTPTGLRGIEQPEEYALVSRIDGFAGAVRDLLDDGEGTAARVEAARRLVEEHFDWSVAASRFADLVEDVATAVPAGRPHGSPGDG